MNLIEQFLDYLRLELNYSQLTVDAYGADLKAWARFATGGKPETLEAMDVTLRGASGPRWGGRPPWPTASWRPTTPPAAWPR